jgi:hypothetical protein
MTVNGGAEDHDVEARTLLVQYLRETCGLTGTKIGCDTSSCGACTVLLDGESVKSCTMLAAQADGAAVTIEGLATATSGIPCRRAPSTTGCGTARRAWSWLRCRLEEIPNQRTRRGSASRQPPPLTATQHRNRCLLRRKRWEAGAGGAQREAHDPGGVRYVRAGSAEAVT